MSWVFNTWGIGKSARARAIQGGIVETLFIKAVVLQGVGEQGIVYTKD